MTICIPLFGERVAPRCTNSDGVLLCTLVRGRITRHEVRGVAIRSIADLREVVRAERVDALVCGGINQDAQQALAPMLRHLHSNVAGTGEDAMREFLDLHIAQRSNNGSDSEHMLDVARDLNAEEERRLCRLSEIVYFCLEMGYSRVGIAYCADLTHPAMVLKRVLERFFTVYAMPCSGREDGLERDVDTVCHPRHQADRLNELGTEINLIVGLCVGADCVFTQASDAPVSTLFVKDRALANNPIGAVYSDRYLREALDASLDGAGLPAEMASSERTSVKRQT